MRTELKNINDGDVKGVKSLCDQLQAFAGKDQPWYTTAKEKVYVSNMNYGFWGWGWNPWFWGPNTNIVSSRTEGVLYIDLIDAITKQLIWQGKGKGGIGEYSKNRDERIGTFVAEILKNYPPQSAL